MQTKLTKVAICAILVTVFVVFGNFPKAGYSAESGISQHFYYMFFHAGWLHLLCNCYSLFLILNTRIFNFNILLPLLYGIAVVSSFFSMLDEPTIGASTIVFGMLGISMAANQNIRSWGLCTAFLAFGFITPGVNVFSHIVAFGLGVISSLLNGKIKALQNDYRTVNRGK